VTNIAREAKVDEKFVAQAMASALSASGGNIEAAKAAVRGAAEFLSDKPTEIAGYAGSLLDLAKVTGTSNAETNKGLLLLVGSLSRVVNPQQQAMNIPRSLIGQMAFGATPRGAAALFAALTTGSGDITGATSGTGAVSLAQQLEAFLPDRKTLQERIAALQSSPELAQQFLAQASFEKTVLGPIRQLLTDPNSPIAKQFRENLARIPAMGELPKISQDLQKRFLLDPLEKNRELKAAFKTMEQGLRVANVPGGEAGVVTEGLRKVLVESGAGWWGTKKLMGEYYLRTLVGGQSPHAAAADLLAWRADFLEGHRRPSVLSGPPTEAEKEQGRLLRQIVEELRRLNNKADKSSSPTLGRPDEDPKGH